MRFGSPRALASAVLLASALAPAWIGAPAFAQDEEAPSGDDSGEKEYRFEFGVYGGGQFFDGEHWLRKFDNTAPGLSPKNAGVFGARFTVNFNPYVGAEGDAFWVPTETKNGATKLSVFG